MPIKARRSLVAVQGLAVLWAIATAATAATAVIATEPAPAVPFPHDYRSWQHVRTIIIGPEHNSFAQRGGIHHYYANDKAVEGYRTGRFPNGSVIVDEGVLTEIGTGPGKGIVFEGKSRTLDVMLKDDRLYKETGGWGFDHFEGEEPTVRVDASKRAACYECHAKNKDRDHVFSAIRVPKFAPAAGQARDSMRVK